MRGSVPKSVDEYIAAQPKAVQPKLEQVRAAIRKAVPEAVEGIGYRMPGYKLEGKPMLYFAGFKEHYSLFAASGTFFATLKDELRGYALRKGTVHFPLAEPVPVKLISRIAKLRAAGIAVEPHFKGDDLGWTSGELRFPQAGTPIYLERYLSDEDELRDDLNASAAMLETFPNTTTTAGYVPSPGWVPPAAVDRAVAYITAHAGQPVTVTVDMYPDDEWRGVVESVSPAAAQEFSLLPAQNTSGNWVKVVQRVPMRIKLDTSDTKLPPLRAGMSVIVDVDTGHARGLPYFLRNLFGRSK